MRLATFVTITALIMFSSGNAQDLNNTIIDEKTGKEILIGYCDNNGLKTGDFGEYYDFYYTDYKPDKTITSELIILQEGIDITIVLGTWCSDSKEHVPRFMKVLDKSKFPKDHLKIICVDKSKEAEGIDVKALDIQRVPTFIFYRNNKELGRIIETPVYTLEKDMLFLLEN
ncbi:thioredoxin family protein [bacterium]|nr:thioredoxin family protein [bacterium]